MREEERELITGARQLEEFGGSRPTDFCEVERGARRVRLARFSDSAASSVFAASSARRLSCASTASRLVAGSASVALVGALVLLVLGLDGSSAPPPLRSEDRAAAVDLDLSSDGLAGPVAPVSSGSCAEYGCQHDFVAAQTCQCDSDCTHERNDCCSDFAATCAGKAAAEDEFAGEMKQPSAAAMEMAREIAQSMGQIAAEEAAKHADDEPSASSSDGAAGPSGEDTEQAKAEQQQSVEEAAALLAKLMGGAGGEPAPAAPVAPATTAAPAPVTTPFVLPEPEPEPLYEVPSTTTTTRWPFPSFLCWIVVRTTGYEVSLVRAQQANKVGVFDCDEYTVFSNGGHLRIGNIEAIVLPAPPVQKGNFNVPGTTTNSWLNTLIFMEAWALVVADGRWWNHEWTVKVDPDAVFFPHRLRELLLIATPSPGDKPRYVGNCDRTWNGEAKELKLFGSLEIFSRDAVGSYKAYSERCKTELHWQGWGEDFFMKSCMDILGAIPVNGTSFLADKRCHFAPCSDPTKVAFHDFKDVQGYFDCWGQSRAQEKMSLRRLGEDIDGVGV